MWITVIALMAGEDPNGAYKQSNQKKNGVENVFPNLDNAGQLDDVGRLCVGRPLLKIVYILQPETWNRGCILLLMIISQ